VDPRLADERAVEAQAVVVGPGDRVVHDAATGARHRVHPDEERGVATLLEERRVLGPVLLHDELALGVEQVRDERVERPLLAGAVAVHHDDLRRTGSLGATDGRVDLLGVQASALVVERLPAGRLPALDDPRDALHVADHVDAHPRSLDSHVEIETLT
jgi:hypothetical protein